MVRSFVSLVIVLFSLASSISAARTPFDFDGDGKADLSIYRPSDNSWHFALSGGGYWSRQFGAAGDKLAPADYDGDGIYDITIFRPSDATWHFIYSATKEYSVHKFGAPGDLPVPASYDGSPKAEQAVVRVLAGGAWLLPLDPPDLAFPAIVISEKPVIGDFNGDGKADYSFYDPYSGFWTIRSERESAGTRIKWGMPGDIPVPADYDGDGKTDTAVYRPSTGQWWVIGSTAGTMYPFVWGVPGDIPAPADYDGDGRADRAVFRPSEGKWYIFTSDGGIRWQTFGKAGDVPVPGAFIN